MLTPEEEQRLADLLESSSFDIRKRILGERGLSQTITVGSIFWLADKLKEINEELKRAKELFVGFQDCEDPVEHGSLGAIPPKNLLYSPKNEISDRRYPK